MTKADIVNEIAKSTGTEKVQGRHAADPADRGGAAARLRPGRPGDDRRQPARATADRGVAGHTWARWVWGAVRLGLRKELEAIADEAEREAVVRQATAALRTTRRRSMRPCSSRSMT